MPKQKRSNLCHMKCNRRGRYYYSRRLAQELGLDPWTGVYLCDECFEELEHKAREGMKDEQDAID